MDLSYAVEVLEHEAAAVRGLVGRIDAEHFGAAARLILACSGRTLVTGMGKAFLIGQKISATLASTGTPSLALHAGEALHGDLGRAVAGDVALVISNSGRTRESVELLAPLKKLGVSVIAMTGDQSSPLAQHADVLLDIGNLDEACPLGLAPTTTTTAMLALGDALALTVLKARDFQREDYARFHPAGSLGRGLLEVEELMRQGDDYAVIEERQPLREALLRITRVRAGAISVTDDEGRLVGIFTDGDLRRRLVKGASIDELKIADLMTRDPTTIQTGRLVSEAIRIMRERKFDELPVVDGEGRSVGVLDIQDVLGIA
ncbi:MAG TPA: KpsF/GutQ family sugar-phosphate isomerase [Planctomycetes bacterium]|nr:KpsF/GutQ family sugar-phosphate isomerase [Planctomycetota bacterium]